MGFVGLKLTLSSMSPHKSRGGGEQDVDVSPDEGKAKKSEKR